MGSKNCRIQVNVGKTCEVLHKYDVGFDGMDGVFSILTKKVVHQLSAERFLYVQKIGKEGYECLVIERIEGDRSI